MASYLILMQLFYRATFTLHDFNLYYCFVAALVLFALRCRVFE